MAFELTMTTLGPRARHARRDAARRYSDVCSQLIIHKNSDKAVKKHGRGVASRAVRSSGSRDAWRTGAWVGGVGGAGGRWLG